MCRGKLCGSFGCCRIWRSHNNCQLIYLFVYTGSCELYIRGLHVAIKTFNQSLEVMITDPANCLRIWVAFCDYMRHTATSALSSSPSHHSSSPTQPSSSSATNNSISEVEELQSTFDRAREYMKTS